MIINFAYAQTATSGGGQGLLVQLLPLILIFVVFYFLLMDFVNQQHHTISLKFTNKIRTTKFL